MLPKAWISGKEDGWDVEDELEESMARRNDSASASQMVLDLATSAWSVAWNKACTVTHW